ncbi:hypothetical protein CERZMDRAFT_118199 [Cercospora zeae-maydis SCOH1-5]|uniref:Uncharacterized protein n=1 Tax=Cercospora zeae-maydis SCOH1-5 TaxID=717836 RepID=A0A6A6FAD9_9PEZI|nr:hypothetical protein CERZMDRAFT_118199 [Cercospora zeae-maydis SCOH1-5]
MTDSAETTDQPPLSRPPSYSTIDTPRDSPPSFELRHPTAATASLQILQNDTALYYAASHNAKDVSDIILHAGYDSKGPQLALLQFMSFSKDFKIYIGGLRSPVGEDWDIVRYAESGGKIFHRDPIHRFGSYSRTPNGQSVKEKLHWQKTRNPKLGASKFSRSDHKLVDEITDEVVAVYVEHSMRLGTHKGTITYVRKLGEMAEMAALMALLGLLERSRRHSKAVSTILGH